MFINKLQSSSGANVPTMSDFICSFLRTEVTCIPGILKKVLGDYYNNAVWNAATWVFVLWCLLHYAFDKIFDAVFKKLKYKQYIRQRLKSSLWYLGFYGAALAYCSATISREEIELFNFKRMSVPSQANLPIPAFIGYTLISTFYLHTSIWEGLKNGSKNSAMSYFFLAIVCTFSSIVKITETVFTFTAVISIGYVFSEITKILYTISSARYISKIFVGSVFIITFLIALILHLIVIPFTFLIPLSLKLLSDFPSISLIIIYISLVAWSAVSLHRSVIYKLIDHWLYHSQVQNDLEGVSKCPGKILECSLFPPRNDFSYNIYIARKEAKIRQAKILAKRKPAKDRLSQTLKCVLTIKRKIDIKKKLIELTDPGNSGETVDLMNEEEKLFEGEYEDSPDELDETESIDESSSDKSRCISTDIATDDENNYCDEKSKVRMLEYGETAQKKIDEIEENCDYRIHEGEIVERTLIDDVDEQVSAKNETEECEKDVPESVAIKEITEPNEN